MHACTLSVEQAEEHLAQAGLSKAALRSSSNNSTHSSSIDAFMSNSSSSAALEFAPGAMVAGRERDNLARLKQIAYQVSRC